MNVFKVILLYNNIDIEQKLAEIKRSLTESEVKVHSGTPEAGLRHKTALQRCTSKPDYEASAESEQLTACSLPRLMTNWDQLVGVLVQVVSRTLCKL